MVGALLATTSVASAQQVDADNLEEAATLGILMRSATDGLRQQCSRLLPEKARDIEALTLYWQDKNKIEVRALDLYKESASKAWLDLIAQLLAEQDKRQEGVPNEKRINQCNSYYGRVTNGQVNISARIPKASSLLVAYANAHLQSEIEYEQVEFVWGCLKQQANRAITNTLDFSIEKARSLCSCLVEIRRANTTPEQRHAEHEYASANGTLPMPAHMPELLPLYQRCHVKP